MARFIIRNYGPSRQFKCKGQYLSLNNDQVIETDDVEEAAALKSFEKIAVTDRGIDAAPATPQEIETKEKKRQITVDNPEAVHREKSPDEYEQQQETGGTQPPESTEDKDTIAYADMTIKELQVLAKDRQPPIKTSGVKKDELIQALENYDRAD